MSLECKGIQFWDPCLVAEMHSSCGEGFTQGRSRVLEVWPTWDEQTRASQQNSHSSAKSTFILLILLGWVENTRWSSVYTDTVRGLVGRNAPMCRWGDAFHEERKGTRQFLSISAIYGCLESWLSRSLQISGSTTKLPKQFPSCSLPPAAPKKHKKDLPRLRRSWW